MSARRVLLVISMEPPFPPNHGGRVDQWNRYSLLKSLGWKLALATWVRNPVDAQIAELRDGLSAVFSEVFLFGHDLGAKELLQRMLALPRYSPHVSSRYVPKSERVPLVEAMHRFRPVAIILDSLYGGLLAEAVASELDLPLLYRANNIEHIYMPMQARVAQSLSQKLKLVLASMHLRRFEMEIHRTARWTFDCSADDLAFWRAKGFSNNSWAPPLFDTRAWANVPRIPWDARPYDAVYLGNLRTPSNIAGLRWFLDEVFPRVVSQRPNIRMLIAGSNPSEQLVAAAKSHTQIDLVANPSNANETRSRGRVLINPLLTGSGINVKMVEMLFTDSPIVTTSIGMQGLDPHMRDLFLFADTPYLFAARLLEALDSGPVSETHREAARDQFGRAAAETFAEQVLSAIEIQ